MDSLENYIRTVKIGDWFVLYQMSKNLNRRFFYDFLLALAQEYEKNPAVIEEQERGEGLIQTETEIKKKSDLNIDMPDGNDGPPPLTQDSPRIIKKEINSLKDPLG